MPPVSLWFDVLPFVILFVVIGACAVVLLRKRGGADSKRYILYPAVPLCLILVALLTVRAHGRWTYWRCEAFVREFMAECETGTLPPVCSLARNADLKALVESGVPPIEEIRLQDVFFGIWELVVVLEDGRTYLCSVVPRKSMVPQKDGPLPFIEKPCTLFGFERLESADAKQTTGSAPGQTTHQPDT